MAPASGVIFSRYFNEGEAIPPLNPIVEIVHVRSLSVKIYISEKMLPHIKYGQKVKVRVDGLSRQFQGIVGWVSPKAEFTPKTIMTPETRTSLVYAVKIRIQNSKGILKDGMPVEVVL
ncbi:putative efflux pump membrane fusion protein [bacterium BMS3Abin05]|nr:putative efflux pump membrane fusion protein [bacterium BMS3Abin05]